ncbi:helix-turn-helix domain-containing protein [Streptomyces sp. NPDC000594]|uniref:helix-turn-helix domain-containing protein n=1 Tax=Streptomyces sp. NPDC000594 TaxID=3154261 RepID=UPI003318F4AE
MSDSKSKELNRLLPAWRKRLPRDEVPGLTARYGRRRRQGLTQEEVADLVGTSSRWYGKLESGAPGPYSLDFLERVSRVLQLGESERHALFFYGAGKEPASRPRPDASSLDPYVADYVRQQELPTYISNLAWDLVIYNRAALAQFPWMAYGLNIMIWVLTYPEARMQLIDWENTWARPMAAQLRMAARKHTGHQRLAEVVREIRERDEVARQILDADVMSYSHPDGSRRFLYLPDHHEQAFEVVWLAFSPLRDPTLRLIVSMCADSVPGGVEPAA